MLSAALYARVRNYLAYCTRDRGCSAHPAFPAPSHFRGWSDLENLARNVRRERRCASVRWKL